MAEAAAERRRRVPPPVVAATGVLVLAVVWAVVVATTTPATSPRAPGPGTPVAADRPAPAFTRPFLRGPGALTLSSYRGSVVVVNFWASWCHACRLEAPDLQTMSRRYRGQGVQFVGVDYEDRPSAGIAAARAFAMPYPSVVDPNGTLANTFGVVGLPMTFVVGPELRIRYAIAGRIRPRSFSWAIDSLLDESAGRSL
jgi:cytochrome c biogenesis protein CcmG/thiol:disulfide interchange protein DsbE